MKNEKKILEHLYKLRNYILISRYKDIDVVIGKRKRINTLEKIDYTFKQDKEVEKEITEYLFFQLLHPKNDKAIIEYSNQSDLLNITFRDLDATISYLRE